jgi:hypothetical protein
VSDVAGQLQPIPLAPGGTLPQAFGPVPHSCIVYHWPVTQLSTALPPTAQAPLPSWAQGAFGTAYAVSCGSFGAPHVMLVLPISSVHACVSGHCQIRSHVPTLLPSGIGTQPMITFMCVPSAEAPQWTVPGA